MGPFSSTVRCFFLPLFFLNQVLLILFGRFFCVPDSSCHFGIKLASILLQSYGLSYAWTFLILLDLLEMAYAMQTKQTLKVPKLTYTLLLDTVH